MPQPPNQPTTDTDQPAPLSADSGAGRQVVGIEKRSNGYGWYYWTASCSCGWQSRRMAAQWASRDLNAHNQQHVEPLAAAPDSDEAGG